MSAAARLKTAYEQLRSELLAAQTPGGPWVGELASSALSTATAISALAIVDRERAAAAGPFAAEKTGHYELIRRGIGWLLARQNPDGGWGDTDRSFSNIATTMLVDAAIRLAGQAETYAVALGRGQAYLQVQGGLAGLRKRYGSDKTFAVPILTNAALAGTVAWKEVSPLPFEMALLPRKLLGAVRLPVVSYALPALIAIGQARFTHLPPWNPVLRWARAAALEGSLKVLESIQPASGGFLEATPLTSFVVMSLAGSGRVKHPVVDLGVKFIAASVRADGSWPIDTNLSTWVTTLALNSLATAGEPISDKGCLPWLLKCQHREVHPYTGAAPGGWAWTDLTGGVPDADDTPGALLALAAWRDSRLEHDSDDTAVEQELERISEAAGWGLRWLLDLQNRDGGWPTFCQGWGALPFDRSGTDLTAHALRAIAAWSGRLAGPRVLSPAAQRHFERFEVRMQAAAERGFRYLARTQRSDGSWVPLWFGNQYHPAEENPVYGTARVVLAYRDWQRLTAAPAMKAQQWLLAHQSSDGGWGGRGLSAILARPLAAAPGDAQALSTVEETSVAVQALQAFSTDAQNETVLGRALARGLGWLVVAVEQERHRTAAPIGFYFAKLWYYEQLYPLVFGVAALGSAVQLRQLPELDSAGVTASTAPAFVSSQTN